MLDGHKDDIYRVQFSGKGNRLLSIGYAGIVNVWDFAAGKSLFTTDLPVVVYNGGYLADGKTIAATAGDNKVYILDLPPEAQ